MRSHITKAYVFRSPVKGPLSTNLNVRDLNLGAADPRENTVTQDTVLCTAHSLLVEDTGSLQGVQIPAAKRSRIGRRTFMPALSANPNYAAQKDGASKTMHNTMNGGANTPTVVPNFATMTTARLPTNGRFYCTRAGKGALGHKDNGVNDTECIGKRLLTPLTGTKVGIRTAETFRSIL